jgi:uncharacterized protein YrrD
LEKYSEVIGLPVICVENGKKIGIIKDIVFCTKYREVKAFQLEKKGYEIRKKVILLKDVLSLGKDALIVNDCNCISVQNKVEKTEDFKDSGRRKGLKVFSKSGDDLGIVNDVMFDYKNGSIEGVEVSDGFLQDIFLGRKVVPLFGKIEVGSENILIDKEALEEILTTGGGLKKIITGETNLEDNIPISKKK